jgi:hypothetical protein
MSDEVKTTRITITVEHDGQKYEKTMRALDSSFEAGDLAEWVRFTGKFMANEVSRKVEPDAGSSWRMYAPGGIDGHLPPITH